VYDFGWRRNLQAVFGSQSLVAWTLPPAWVGLAGAGDGTGLSMAELATCGSRESAEPAARPVREVFAALSSEFASDLARSAAGLRAGAPAPPAGKGGAQAEDGDEESGARAGGGGGRRVA
jgi:hypothetical protein